MVHKDVLITDYVHPVLTEGLHSLGLTTTYAPEMSRKEMEEALPFYKGVVINTRCAIDRAAVASAPSLRWIARLGSGQMSKRRRRLPVKPTLRGGVCL